MLLNSNAKLLIKLSNIKQEGAAVTEYLPLHRHDEKCTVFIIDSDYGNE